MKSIRRFFVLLLAVLMLIGMALPACAEELAPGDETIAEETEPPSVEESSADAEPSTEEKASTAEETSTEEPSSEEPSSEEPSGAETPIPAPEVQAASLLPEDEPIALDGDSPVFEISKSSLSSLSGALSGSTVYYLGKNAYNYILKEDITLDKPMYLQATATLDLNGHKLSYSGTGSAITVTGHILTLTNSGSASTAMVTTESTSATVFNIDGGVLTFSNCSVVGNVTSSGSINCSNGAQFKGFSNGTTATVTNTGFINIGSFASGCKVVNNKIGDNSGYILDGTFNGPVESSGIIEKGTFSGAVENSGTIQTGTFSGAVSVSSTGTIENGSFTGTVYNNGYLTGGTYSNTVTNGATITGGTFSKKVTNGGTITNGSFSGEVENSTGTIKGGTFSEAVTNMQRGNIQSGSFSGAVTNNGSIKGGTFGGTVMNHKTIENGTFNGTVENHDTIAGGTFNNDVTNLSTITGGTFNKPVNSRQHGSITGGTFNSTVENGGSITGGLFYGGDPDPSITNNKHTVSFDPDGGTLNGQTTIPSQCFIGSVSASAKNPGTPSKPGYTFDGWYKGDAKYGFTETVSADVALKAKWKPSPPPTFIGLESGGEYCFSVEFSVLDHSDSVTVDASAGTLTDKGSNTYCLSSSSQQDITVTATNANNETTSVTITLYATHSGDATCKNKAACDRCGVEYNGPHNLEHIIAKANTSSEAGNREHWKCSVCGKCFADDAGNTELSDIATALPKLISLTQDNIDSYLHKITDSWSLSAGTRLELSYYFRLDTDIDISEKGLIEFGQVNCTLDLNDHTLTLDTLQISNKSLILTDSSTAGTGCLQGRIGTYNAILYAAGGRIVSETLSSSIDGDLQALPGSTKTTVFDTPVSISSSGRVSTGTFCKRVDNRGTITGGIFHGYVSKINVKRGTITGGVFYGGVENGMIGSDATVHTVTFDSKGGSGSIPAQLFVNTDTAPALKPADPTRDGYAFLGWYKSGEGAPYDFSAPVTDGFTLEARWQSHGYTITYETNGGTLPESYPTSYATGSTISLPKPTRTGYTFEGWYESADFSGDKLTAIAPTEARNITLYANWTPAGDGKPASIGSQSYDTLADALTAAKNGDQIMLKANANPAESVAVGKEVILVNPGFTGYTITAAEGYAMTTSTVGSITIYSFKYTDETPAEPPVAMIGDVEYTSVAAALIAATSGQTVTVLADASEGSLIVKAGITLDLNGHDLTADALVALTGAQVINSGSTINSTNGGLLKISKGNVKLDPSNPQVTLWLADKGGYQLVSVTHHMDFPSKSESRFVARSYPQFDTAIETLLATGNASDKGLSVQMRIQWINSSGIVQSQTYQFTDTHVHKVYADILSFGLTVTGISNIQTMDVTTMIVSDTGVTLTSSAIHYDKANLTA